MKKIDFRTRVLSVVRRIPPGRVSTYGDVAKMAGKPRAARAVGNIMRDCGRADVPAHRVIAAGGRLGGYGGNEAPQTGAAGRGRRTAEGFARRVEDDPTDEPAETDECKSGPNGCEEHLPLNLV